MDKVYNRKGKLAGYLKGNIVYNRHNEIIGYTQENVFFDANSSPIAFVTGNAIYTVAGMPWAYVDNRVIRDMSGRRIGKINRNSVELLAASSVLGMGIGLERPAYVQQGYAQQGYNTGAYRTQGGLGGALFGGLGSIGTSMSRLFFGGPRQMGYGAGPYYQQQANHYNRAYNNSGYRNEHHRDKENDHESRHYESRNHETSRHAIHDDYNEQVGS